MRKERAGLDLVERADERGDLPLVGIDGGIVDEPGRQAEGQRRLAPHHLRHRRDLGVGGDPRDIRHHHPAHGRMAEIDPHVGDRAPAMPGEEFGDRTPCPFAFNRAVERLQLRGVLRALRLGHGGRRQAVDAADAFRHPAENGEFAGDRQAAYPERRAAERAVVVGVDEAGRERAPARIGDTVGGRGFRRAHGAERGDDVAVDHDVAGKGRRAPVAGDDHRVADELAGHCAALIRRRRTARLRRRASWPRRPMDARRLRDRRLRRPTGRRVEGTSLGELGHEPAAARRRRRRNGRAR